MRTEDDFIARIKALLADEHERPQSAFDHLIPQMRAAYARDGAISDGDMAVIFQGSDDENLPDQLADRYPLLNEIAASLDESDNDDD